MVGIGEMRIADVRASSSPSCRLFCAQSLPLDGKNIFIYPKKILQKNPCNKKEHGI